MFLYRFLSSWIPRISLTNNYIIDIISTFISASPSSKNDEEGGSEDAIDKKVAAQERQLDAVEDDIIMEDYLDTSSTVEDLNDKDPLTDDINIAFLHKKNPGSLVLLIN